MNTLILALPLISFTTLAFFGRFLGKKGSSLVALNLIGLSLVFSLISFYEGVINGSLVRLKLFSWIRVGVLDQSFSFLFDDLTTTMLVVVLGVSFLVHLYSLSYMGQDPHLVRFISFLSLFTFFMLCLVTSGNVLQMFLGWEGVGLASYLLINFWYTRLSANKAAIKAVVVNRFGDFALVIVILVTYVTFRTFDYGLIFAVAPFLQDSYIVFLFWEFHTLSVLSFFIFIGCVGKSAQMGLHTWLPDAMEGPTPVSALIHAATMVTAGVFLLIRFAPLLELAPLVLNFVALLGGLTAFFAATVGVFQNDLKRVIAYSTCSQLGYMVLACGLSEYSLSLFHLMNHAFFKALLFLSAGAVIHALADEQDMRRMGGLVKILPFTYVCFVVGSLALMAFPYTSGFYSKDLILENALLGQSVGGSAGYWAGLLAAFCTAFYSFRLLYLVFLAETNTNRSTIRFIHEPDLLMTIPLLTLLVTTVFVGYVFRDAFVGLGSPLLSFSAVAGQQLMSNPHFSEFLFASDKAIPVLFSLFWAFLALALYYTLPFTFAGRPVATIFIDLYEFFNKKWFFDVVYNTYVVRPMLIFGYSVTFKVIDRGIIELWGPTGAVRSSQVIAGMLRLWQSGYIFNYVASMVIGFNLLLFFSFSRNSIIILDTHVLSFILLSVAFFSAKKVSASLENLEKK